MGMNQETLHFGPDVQPSWLEAVRFPGVQFVVADPAFSTHSVRRGDLESQGTPSAPSSPNQNLETRFREQLEQLYHLEDHSSETAIAANILNGNGVPPKESLQDENNKLYDFRLFAKPIGKEESRGVRSDIARIALRTPSPLNGEPGFINPHRPEGYYFTKHPNAEEVQRFHQAAISGEDILEGLRTGWVMPHTMNSSKIHG